MITNTWPLVQLKCVVNILVLITIKIKVYITLVAVTSHHHFLPVIIFRVHVQSNYISQTVIIYIHNILAHGSSGSMFKILFRTVGEGAVMVIDIQDIIREKIIGYINVFPAVHVYICNGSSMRITFGKNACLFGNIRKNRMI